MNKKFQLLFSLYKDFLEIDAVASLSYTGRNRNIINKYFLLFSSIVNDNNDLFNNTLKHLVKLQKDYINNNLKKKIQIYNTDILLQDHISRRLQTDIHTAFKNFYIASQI